VSDRHFGFKGIKRLLLAGGILFVGACAAPSGTAPIDDRTRGGQRAAPAQPVPATGMHTVQRGETLYQIAFRYGTDWRTLAANNGLTQPFTIFPGQQISIGSGPTPAARAPAPASPPRAVAQPAPSAPSRPPATSAPRATPVPPGATSSRPATPAPTAQVPARVAGWNWPADGPLIARFQSNGSLNKGIDIAGQLGQPVRAAADGAVVYAGRGLIGYGEMVIIKHDETYLSAYAHNSRLMVNEGDRVRAGQTIAEMGSSGTDRVKLHFEIRRRGQPVDPLSYLPKR
jgi:lipoprotein NlpD